MSLRLAIIRSLDVQPSESTESANNAATDDNDGVKKEGSNLPIKKRKKLSPAAPPPVVDLPKIDKCIRNKDPVKIDNYGFVEIKNVLPKSLIDEIRKEATENKDVWQQEQEGKLSFIYQYTLQTPYMIILWLIIAAVTNIIYICNLSIL